ncbi:MAG: signal peptide peptidase SppA [Desulfovibrionales bacterium]|nr:signal peptide peptidase SppA [Desulfovibrionales bacterium]
MDALDKIRRFFGATWKVLGWIRSAVANIVFLLLLAFVLVGLLGDKEEPLEANSVLVIDPDGQLVEESVAPEPAEIFLKKMGREPSKAEESKAQDVIDAIRQAAGDSRIKAVVIDPGDLIGCDTTKLMDIGKALRNFKESGKPVLAHSSFYTQGQFLLASYADAVYLSPLGGVSLTGFGTYPTYFKGLLDKARVNVHVYRVGEYKTAVEPFLRDSMSEQARESNREWLDALWQAYLNEAARNRSISTESILAYVNNIDTKLGAVGGDAARLAVTTKLVDDIKTIDQFDLILATKIGLKPEDVHRVGFKDYLRLSPYEKPISREMIGVIRARGPIVPGQQPESMTGSESVADLFRQARQDPSIVAVVLRLDSSGGSATAAEDIHREIVRTQDAGKPVVVSLGSVAASGAYWIAAGANRIVAAPTTLTGSIGIFAAFPTFENTARDWGVTTDGVGTTDIADLGNPLRPIPPRVSTSIQFLLEHGYKVFLDRVAKGRRMTAPEVEELAQGKVFLGQTALARKLVDQAGGLDEAIKAAADLAGLTNAASRDLRREPTPREKLLQNIFSSGAALLLPRTSGPMTSLLHVAREHAELLDSFTDPHHIYARSLECEAVTR